MILHTAHRKPSTETMERLRQDATVICMPFWRRDSADASEALNPDVKHFK